jgi:hypothetical protein
MKDYNNSKIYQIFSNLPELSSKVYIGATIKKTLAGRMSDHRSNARSGKSGGLYDAMRMHGPDNFIIELIEIHECTMVDELNARVLYFKYNFDVHINSF